MRTTAKPQTFFSNLLYAFGTQDTGIFCGDTEATLTGETYDGAQFSGTDTVTTSDYEDTGCHPQSGVGSGLGPTELDAA
jgi:hypothetical protein